jgi:flavin-dependent dehydrogenase
MVTEMKDYTGKWFETLSDGFKTCMEAGRFAQESMFKAAGTWFPEGGENEAMGEVRDRTQRLARAWQPTMRRNADTAMTLLDANYKAGMDLAKASFDTMHDLNRENFEDRTRRMWDASFGAVRTNVNALSTATKATMESFVDLCHSASTTKGEPKSAPKQPK